MPADPRPLISIVVPVLNEDQNIERLYAAVRETMDPVADRYRYELVFTDNHSTDRSFELLSRLAASDSRVRVLRFSRNFGYQASILTGYLNAAGDAIVQLDCDLQDPPRLILEFLRRWEEGYKVVYAVRKRRQEGVVITAVRAAFYRILNALSEHPLPLDAGDFRLVDRRIVEELRKIDDATPYLRGTITTLGFRQIGIEYDRDARRFGESKFGLKEMIRLAADGLMNHSTAPLRFATYCSQTIFLLACLLLGGYCLARLTIGSDWPAGFTTTVALILLSTSLNAFLFGIQGEYIGRIHRQLKRHPLTIVEESVNNVATENRSSAPVPADHTRAA